jgi:hypothetical protein
MLADLCVGNYLHDVNRFLFLPVVHEGRAQVVGGQHHFEDVKANLRQPVSMFETSRTSSPPTIYR